MEEKGKKRIDFGMIVIWVVSAVFIDLINLIPFLGGLISSFYWIVFSFYLWKTGHGLLNWKIAISEIISIVVEWIPFLGFLPSTIASTIAIVAISRFEDKTGKSLIPNQTMKKMTLPRNQRKPVNAEEGIRPPNQ
ncbi:MAG: hypothetical protein AAB637_01745 [Patescibacteria group bacterium]